MSEKCYRVLSRVARDQAEVIAKAIHDGHEQGDHVTPALMWRRRVTWVPGPYTGR